MTNEVAIPLAGALGEGIVFGLLLYRKVWRNMPVFTIYVLWTFLSELTSAYITARYPSLYFNYFLYQVTIDSSLFFAVLVELVWSVLRPVRASLPKATIYVLGALIAIAGAVIWPLATKTVPPGFGPQSSLLFHLQGTFAILRVACFLVLASLSQVLSIGMRDRELQVATGFGFYSIIALIVAVLHSNGITDDLYHKLDLTASACYLGTLSYWVLSFSTREQERKEFSPQMQQLLLSMSGGASVSRSALDDLPSDRSKKNKKKD